MTRKEVCKATGLSVKTLRLYEEKGLIAPAREYRNGREYRTYTPKLVEQLSQIATLRRALFTMEEIKTMQEQPEKIAGVFQQYQQWLRLQEQQLHQLRQAADRIRPETLSDLDGLIAQLRGPAAAMPLPATDIKPNFKRLDELDEGPRHVEAQVDLDDMVPNATVFRQVNIMVDRDRGNDVNLALGQLQATVRGFQEEGGSGPVRGKTKAPLWRRILTGCLIILLLILLISAQLSSTEIPGITVLFWGDVGLLVLLWVIPLWLEHRNWVKTAQQEDLQRQQARSGVDPAVYERARKKRRQLILLGICGVLLLAGGIYALARTLYAQAHPDTDCRIFFAAPAGTDRLHPDIEAMEAMLGDMVGDVDGNGEVLALVDFGEIAPDSWFLNGEAQLGGIDLTGMVSNGGFYSDDTRYTLFFLADAGEEWMNPCTDFTFYHRRNFAKDIPVDMDSLTPRERAMAAYRMDLSGTKLMEAAGLTDVTVYACISESATEEEYKLAVDLLRKISAS